MIVQQERSSNKELSIFVVPCPNLVHDRPISYEMMMEACKSLMKNLINKQDSPIVYTLNQCEKSMKIWNGYGVELGSPTMRYACRNKDIVMIVKRNEDAGKLQRQTKVIIDRMDLLKPVASNQTHSTNSQKSPYMKSMVPYERPAKKEHSQQQISSMVRSVNSKCIIGFVYLDDHEPSSEELKNVNVGSGMTVIPKIEKDDEEYQVLVSTSTKSSENSLIAKIIDDIGWLYCHSSKSGSEISEKLFKPSYRSSIEKRQTQPAQIEKRHKKPQTFSIESIFSCCVPKKKSIPQIKLVKIKQYIPIQKMAITSPQKAQKWPYNLRHRHKDL